MRLFIVMKVIVLWDLCAKQSVNGLLTNIKVQKKISLLDFLLLNSVHIFFHASASIVECLEGELFHLKSLIKYNMVNFLSIRQENSGDFPNI